MTISPITASSGPHPTFTLSTRTSTYAFSVDPASLDLIHLHYGPVLTCPSPQPRNQPSGWGTKYHDSRREFPDLGHGDFRLPGIIIRHSPTRHTVTSLKYSSYTIVKGKPPTPGLPATFGSEDDVSTLEVILLDEMAQIKVKLRYSVFPELDAVARGFEVVNEGKDEAVIERGMSWSCDMQEGEWEALHLAGDWAEECQVVRRPVGLGTMGLHSLTGYSSHMHNPFLSLLRPWTTETQGEAYGLSLVWTGSHSFELERSSRGYVRVQAGIHPYHLAWPLQPGESFTSPEVVAIYSANQGIGGMSRKHHSLFRKHLIRSSWVDKPRPVLINNWEATYFDFDQASLLEVAAKGAGVGVKLFVMDDGWFGVEHPRVSDHAGLGDWTPNPKRFPDGLRPFVDSITQLDVQGADDKQRMKFGIWVEPEMLNPQSELYEAHPDWVLHAGEYERTTQRNQLVLNLALSDVQDYIINSISGVLESADISYVKWDNNRGMHELDAPHTATAYVFGLYRVLETLTTRFPDVLWEGCASGGGRFDPGMLSFFPQQWTSDNTDALSRISIQLGTSIVYPASAMGCHVSAVPNHQVGRVTPLEFRAHVAMMGGSFGFELDVASLSAEEVAAIPALVALSERISPLVISGDMYKLAGAESNWPAVTYVSADKKTAVLLAFQIRGVVKKGAPPLLLQGLEEDAKYEIQMDEESRKVEGRELMGLGVRLTWKGDWGSKVIWLKGL